MFHPDIHRDVLSEQLGVDREILVFGRVVQELGLEGLEMVENERLDFRPGLHILVQRLVVVLAFGDLDQFVQKALQLLDLIVGPEFPDIEDHYIKGIRIKKWF